MTDRLEDVVLTRPTTGRPGPLDERLYDLIEARFPDGCYFERDLLSLNDVRG